MQKLIGKLRPVFKGLSWRMFAAFDTMLVTAVIMYARTGTINSSVFALAGGIVGMELLTKTSLYVMHEKLWDWFTATRTVAPVIDAAVVTIEDAIAKIDEHMSKKEGRAND